MKNKVSYLNATLKPLSEGVEPPSEVPEVNYIYVSHEEYEGMFKEEVKDET